MPRRKAAEVEILPPEDDQPSRGRKKLVEAEHTIKYSAPVPVTIEEEAETDEAEEIEIEGRPRRKTSKNERDELRKKLAQNNVTPGSQLKLTIEKYPHSEATDGNGGSWAGADYCTKYACAEAHITNEDYLDVARKWGAGLYRFTLRMQNKIVTAWDKRINASLSGPVVQNVNPADPGSPQVIVQSDGQQTVMPSIKDIMKVQREALKEQLEMAKLMREAYGFAPEQSQQQPRTEEEILSSAILKQPEVIENVVGSVIKRFGGASGKDDEPWYADVVRDAVKSGQLVQVVQVAIDRIFNGFSGLFPGRQNNGQDPTVASTTAQTQHPSDSNALLSDGVQQVHSERIGEGVSGVSPEEHALARLIDNCRRGVPVQVAFEQLIGYADMLNDQAPQYSIDGYISMFAAMPIEAALEFVKTQPNGEQVTSLPHAQAWTEQLQKLIKEAGQEGDEG